MRVDREHQLYEKIARYLQLQYPGAIYRFDIAADLKLTMGQAAKHKRLHPRRGYPDLFIAEPTAPKAVKKLYREDENGAQSVGYVFSTKDSMDMYAGLYLELKAEGNSPFKKDGSLKKDEHLEEQQAMLESLRVKGYKAEFAVGFEGAKQIIDDYLGSNE